MGDLGRDAIRPFPRGVGGRDIHLLAVQVGIDGQVVSRDLGAAPGAHQLDVRSLRGNVGGPARLRDERGAVFEPDEGGGEVFHVEDALHRVAQPGVGGAHHGLRARVAHQPAREIDHVDAEVDQGAAAGLGLAREPRPGSRNAAPPQPAGFGIVDLAQHVLLDELLQDPGLGAEPVVQGDHEEPAVAPGGRGHVPRLPRVQGHGLFAQHVGARVQDVDGHRRVEEIREADADQVGTQGGQVPVVGERVGHVVPRRGFPGQPVIEVGQSDDLDPFVLQVAGEMGLPEPQPDHAGGRFLVHSPVRKGPPTIARRGRRSGRSRCRR